MAKATRRWPSTTCPVRRLTSTFWTQPTWSRTPANASCWAFGWTRKLAGFARSWSGASAPEPVMRERQAGAADAAGLGTSRLSHRACHPVNDDIARLFEKPNRKIVGRRSSVSSRSHRTPAPCIPVRPERLMALASRRMRVSDARETPMAEPTWARWPAGPSTSASSPSTSPTPTRGTSRPGCASRTNARRTLAQRVPRRHVRGTRQGPGRRARGVRGPGSLVRSVDPRKESSR
jgi:hypothetical protein